MLWLIVCHSKMFSQQIHTGVYHCHQGATGKSSKLVSDDKLAQLTPSL